MHNKENMKIETPLKIGVIHSRPRQITPVMFFGEESLSSNISSPSNVPNNNNNNNSPLDENLDGDINENNSNDPVHPYGNDGCSSSRSPLNKNCLLPEFFEESENENFCYHKTVKEEKYREKQQEGSAMSYHHSQTSVFSDIGIEVLSNNNSSCSLSESNEELIIISPSLTEFTVAEIPRRNIFSVEDLSPSKRIEAQLNIKFHEIRQNVFVNAPIYGTVKRITIENLK